MNWYHPHLHRAVADDAAVITDVAIVAALSVALGQLRLLQLPFGGSITLAMLPIVLLAIVRGWRVGVVTGVIAGAMHALVGGTLLHPIQIVLDYSLAWAVLGLAGLVPVASMAAARAAIAIAGLAHLAVFTVSGIVFFGAYAGDMPVGQFSLAYNAMHVVPETVIAMLLIPTALRAWRRAHPAPLDQPVS